jgi:hypothetical protein
LSRRNSSATRIGLISIRVQTAIIVTKMRRCGGGIEVAGLQQLNSLSNQRVIENDRAENRALGVWTAGKCAFKDRVTVVLG